MTYRHYAAGWNSDRSLRHGKADERREWNLESASGMIHLMITLASTQTG